MFCVHTKMSVIFTSSVQGRRQVASYQLNLTQL